MPELTELQDLRSDALPLIRLPDAHALIGVDPYDAMLGSRVPGWIRSNARMRQLVIQLRKRIPVELGGVLGVAPFPMVKSGGAALTALSRWSVLVKPDSSQQEDLLSFVLESPTRGTVGGWGYEFDVQTRWAFYPANSQNMISTVFVLGGLAELAVSGGRSDGLAEVANGAQWIADQISVAGTAGPFLRYVPSALTLVHNANALGAGALATAGVLCARPRWSELALECAATTVSAQNSDGGWSYGTEPNLAWEDNFHTAYTLSGLLQVWLATGDSEVKRALDVGVEGWSGRFFDADGAPRYKPKSTYPRDIHCAATAVDVASRLATWGWGTTSLATRVRDWTSDNLIDASKGVTRYQTHRIYRDGRHFVRWGDAHQWLADSSYALLVYGEKSPSEAALRAPGMGVHGGLSTQPDRGDG